MMRLGRGLSAGIVMSGMLLAACDQSPTPPPPKTEVTVSAPVVNEETKRIASEIYVYAYPLVLMDVTRQVASAKVPANSMQHKRALPDASTTDLVYPNVDTLESQAWLDLSKEPVILSVPDTHGRYYLMQLHDAWTNVFSSLGKRTTGTEKADFAIMGPGWKGQPPKEVQEIRAPTQMVWLIGRTQVNGKADYPAVTKLQDQYKVTTLSHWRKRAGKGGEATAASPAGVDVKTPPVEQVAKMDPPTFLSRFAMLLVANPPAKEDAPMVEKMAKLGIVPGRAFDASSLDAMATKGLEEGYKLGVESIAAAARGAIGDIRNGWTIHLDLGRYGLNYGKRAVIASLGLGASAPEDAINPTSHLDGTGKPLNGAKKYVVHFDAGKTPPTEAFWSLTAYNDKHLLVANPIDRFAIGSRDKLNVNADGSIDVYVQNPSPGKDKEANWLPAPKDSFNVIMRIYWPKPDVLEGRWAPPPIRPVG